MIFNKFTKKIYQYIGERIISSVGVADTTGYAYQANETSCLPFLFKKATENELKILTSDLNLRKN